MSTTFEVFPNKDSIPIIGQVIPKAIQTYNLKLESLGINRRFSITDIKINLVKSDGTKIRMDQSCQFTCGRDDYIFIMLEGVEGGTDINFREIDQLAKDRWEEYKNLDFRVKQISAEVERSVAIGYYWTFRRSIGQHPFINIFYGILAGEVAKEVDGWIWSDDGGWESKIFPSHADVFLEHYFDLSKTQDPNFKIWIEKNMDINEQEENSFLKKLTSYVTFFKGKNGYKKLFKKN